MEIFIFLLLSVLVFLSFNWLMGYKKGNITIDFDTRYIDFQNYVKAIEADLKEQGREAVYIGDRKFLIDGKTYIFIERNVSMGGVPLQRTILKLEK